MFKAVRSAVDQVVGVWWGRCQSPSAPYKTGGGSRSTSSATPPPPTHTQCAHHLSTEPQPSPQPMPRPRTHTSVPNFADVAEQSLVSCSRR